MKILAIHNFHRKGSASGDDQVFKNEVSLLKEKDNTVIEYSRLNNEFDSANFFKKFVITWGMLWSFKSYKEVKKIIIKEKPDIVHVHTFFPLLSPSILYAAKRCGCKVVVTLHDTRFICPCATSLYHNNICNECIDGNYFRMIKKKCFKHSALQSFIVAFIFLFHRFAKSFYKQIDKYICLNDNQIKLLIKSGFDKNKVIKKYNFVSDEFLGLNIETPELPSRYVVYYGRIGEEKGIEVLKKVWDQISDIPLVIMGGGPLELDLKEWAEKKENVTYHGYTQHNKCLAIVKRCEFVFLPSICYEGCSMVEVEAESLGKAIIATDLGFSSEAIRNGYNGYKVSLNNVSGFVKIITSFWKDINACKKMGENARKDYENKYMPEDNYRKLISIYQSILLGVKE